MITKPQDRQKAWDLAYDALEAATPGRMLNLAKKALEIDLRCIDALSIFSSFQRNIDDRISSPGKCDKVSHRI